MRKAKCKAFVKLSFYRHGTRASVTNRLVYHVKEKRDRVAERCLAEMLWDRLREQIEEGEPMAVTYLPRTRKAKAKYGTDQAEALARMLAEVSGGRFERALVRSKRGEREQKKLTSAGRIRNAKTAFCLHPRVDLRGYTVILVDDIVTTGASMAAGARLLRAAGAKRILCAAIASDDVNREWATDEVV
jgi:ComF family protein